MPKVSTNNYSLHNKKVVDEISRFKKAKQILTVLRFYTGKNTFKEAKLLDVGCSVGVITYFLSDFFKQAVGVDIDQKAIDQAQRIYSSKNLMFKSMDGVNMKIPSNTFNFVICNQVYVNVSNPDGLMEEIFRVLKPGGICFFGAPNKYQLWENQYELPFYSFLPGEIAKLYLRVLGKKTLFVTHYRSFWQLQKMCSQFIIHRYTGKIVSNPTAFNFSDLGRFQALLKVIPLDLLNALEPFLPNFIWILEKPNEKKQTKRA